MALQNGGIGINFSTSLGIAKQVRGALAGASQRQAAMMLPRMPRCTMRPLASLLAGIALACGGATFPTAGVQIYTDASSYPIGMRGARVRVTVTNVSDRSTALATCGGVLVLLVEWQSGRDWVGRQQFVCANVPYEQLILAPGDSITGETFADPIGTHRVRASLFTGTRNLRFSRETSASFQVY